MKNCAFCRIGTVILLAFVTHASAQDSSILNGPPSDFGTLDEKKPMPKGLEDEDESLAEEDDVKHNTKSQYDYDVRKNVLTGSKTYTEKAEGEVRVGDQKYRQKYHHKRKISKEGKVLSDEEVSRTFAE